MPYFFKSQHKPWKRSRCPSVGERVSKPWSIQTMECYSALQGNELSSHGGNLSACYCVREAIWKGFQPYDIPEKAELWRQ